MGCVNCERLKREIRELKEEIEEWEAYDGEVVDSEAHDLSRKIGVRPQAAKLLITLMDAPGQTISVDRLARAIGYEGDDNNGMVAMAAHALRAGGVPIETVWGKGRRVRLSDVERIKGMME